MPSALSTEILLSTSELYGLLEKDSLLPVFVGSLDAFEKACIPGSVHIAPSELVCGVAPATGKLPDVDDLSVLFSRIGLEDNRIVIAYDDEGGGWAGRLIWTLDVIGHENYHYLDGGITAWLADGLATTPGQRTANKGSPSYQIHLKKQLLVTANDIIDQLENMDFTIWDARSAQEHSGEKVLAARGGRIPGAKNLDWLDLMDRANHLRLKPLDKIAKVLEDLGITRGKHVVTHCQTHHRSGLTYLVGKLLKLNIQAYDGSWSEWGNLPDTPIENEH